MCGRYALSEKPDDIAKRFDLATVPKDVQPNFNAAPSQTMPVITAGADGVRQVELMRWGIHRTLGKDLVRELINTRSDKAFGGFWRKTVSSHRCLVPANGFYEWKATADGKVPYFIRLTDVDLFAFAGIWDLWRAEDGQEIKTYSIMTSEPNKEMRAVHSRMPVMLHPEDEAAWLDLANNTQESVGELLLPSEDNRLTIYEVSRDVNNPRNNSAALLQPVA